MPMNINSACKNRKAAHANKSGKYAIGVLILPRMHVTACHCIEVGGCGCGLVKRRRNTVSYSDSPVR